MASLMKPKSFLRNGGNVIASYDAVDFFEGSGIVTLYGAGTRDSTGVKYKLVRDTIRTSNSGANLSTPVLDNFSQGTTNEADYVKIFDLDFDTNVLGNPQVLKGTFHAQIPYNVTTSDGSATGLSYVSCVLKKVATNGSTETTIGTYTSNVHTAVSPGNADVYFSFGGLVPSTSLGQGEKVRVTVEFYTKRTTGNSSYVQMFYDPYNLARASTGAPYLAQSAGYTQMKFSIPFKIVK